MRECMVREVEKKKKGKRVVYLEEEEKKVKMQRQRQNVKSSLAFIPFSPFGSKTKMLCLPAFSLTNINLLNFLYHYSLTVANKHF